MTKRECARALAEHMHEVRESVNVERQTEVLMRAMTQKELEAALRYVAKRG